MPSNSILLFRRSIRQPMEQKAKRIKTKISPFSFILWFVYGSALTNILHLDLNRFEGNPKKVLPSLFKFHFLCFFLRLQKLGRNLDVEDGQSKKSRRFRISFSLTPSLPPSSTPCDLKWLRYVCPSYMKHSCCHRSTLKPSSTDTLATNR